MRIKEKTDFIRPLLPIWLATYLYWHNLENIRTTWDHAYPLAQAHLLLTANQWPVLGQVTTFFLSNPPGQAFMNVLPLITLRSSWGVYWFMATLNILAIPLVYRLGRDIYNKDGAFIAATLYAASPWIVLYSRGNWAQALAPFFTAVILTLLLRVDQIDNKRASFWYFFGGLLAFTLFSQSYLLVFVVGSLQVAALLLLQIKRINWFALLAGAFFFVLFTGLFIVALGEEGYLQSTYLAKLQGGDAPYELKTNALKLAASYVSGLNFYLFKISVPPILAYVSTVLGVLISCALFAGIIRALRSYMRGDSKGKMKLGLLLWWIIPIILLSYNNRVVHDWHSILTIPAGHLLVAGGLVTLLKYRWGKPLLSIGIVAAIIPLIMLSTLSDQFNAKHPAFADIDQITLGASIKLGEEIKQLTDLHGLDEIYTSLPPTTIIAWSEKPLKTISWYIDPGLLIMPLNTESLYMRLGHEKPPESFDLGSRLSTITFPNNDFVSFDLLPSINHMDALDLPENQVNWSSDTGLTMLGYTLIGDMISNKEVQLLTYWLIEDLVDDRSSYIYSPYLHLNTTDGMTLVNAGGSGLPGYYYRLNDIYVQPITFTVPDDVSAGEYELDIGLYDGLHQRGTTFFPPTGIPQPFLSSILILADDGSVQIETAVNRID